MDGSRRVIGTLTDGDIRRCLLVGGTLETPVVQAMKADPLIAQVGSSDSHLVAMMQSRKVIAIPLVNALREFVRIAHIGDLNPDNGLGERRCGFGAGVIMAGGEGLRLRPLTKDIPKPLIEVGGVPLIERLARRLVKAGVPRIFVAVNYLGHLIKEHFGKADLGVPISYLREETKLGTAGALSLLPELSDPVVVLNGDILTTSDIGSLYTFHEEHDADLTVAAVDYRIQIPYGVIRAKGSFLEAIEEKPSQRFFCNAGIYALSPETLGMVKPGFCDMPNLINDCLAAGKRVTVFPVHEYWTDVGTPSDLERAREVFVE